MPTVFAMRRCAKCDKVTQHLSQRPNHILHLLLSVVTLGLWLIVWLCLALAPKWYQCGVCGEARR